MARASSFRAAWEPRLLSIVRLVAGLLFMEHGTAKLFGFPHVGAFAHLQLVSLFGLAGVLETFGGFLVAVGLFTRPAAFIVSGEMAVAYFKFHFPHSFFPGLNGGGEAILDCFIFLYLSLVGGGAWSLDRFRRR